MARMYLFRRYYATLNAFFLVNCLQGDVSIIKTLF